MDTLEDSSGLVVMAVENGLGLKPDSNSKCRSGVLTNSTVPTPRYGIERGAGRDGKEVSFDEEKKQGSSHLINIRRETADVTVCIKPLIDFNALFICVNKS